MGGGGGGGGKGGKKKKKGGGGGEGRWERGRRTGEAVSLSQTKLHGFIKCLGHQICQLLSSNCS